MSKEKEIWAEVRLAIVKKARLYFYLWSYRSQIRHKLKVSSLWILSVSTILLWVEVLLEWKGHWLIHFLLESFNNAGLQEASISRFVFALRATLLVLFIIACLFLLWHHLAESKKPSYEYKFVRQLGSFIQTRRTDNDIPKLFKDALEVFFPVFDQANVKNCSVYFSNGTQLGIPCGYVHLKADANYVAVLERGEGITGLVCQDMSPRYVPRLFLPFSKKRSLLAKLLFSHAIKFEVQDERGILKQKADDIDYFAFEDPTEGELQFRSFVSVPLISVQAGTCFGSLNFDFYNPGSLDKFDIAMAAAFGVLLADEIRRLQPVAKNGGG